MTAPTPPQRGSKSRWVAGLHAARSEGSPHAWFQAGENVNLEGEEPQEVSHRWEPIPPRERTRRGVLVGLTVAFVVVLLLQIGFALLLNDAMWARVGPILSIAATLVATGFGFAWGHYFSGKD